MATRVESRAAISRRFLRSIHLERDAGNAEALSDYVVTGQARQILRQFLAALAPAATERAFTVTGPYGTGKSAFALFLAELLGSADPSVSHAWRQLRAEDPDLAARLARTENARPLLPILVTARRASPSHCILERVSSVARCLRNGGSVAREAEKQIASVRSSGVADSKNTVNLIHRLAEEARGDGYRGVLVVVDELGKLLEHAALQVGEDLGALQELAELASRSADKCVLLVGLLHQSFDQYGRYLDRTTRNEWAKIHGRFTDIAFLEPPEQLIHLISRAIGHSETQLDRVRTRHIRRLAALGTKHGIVPDGLKSQFPDMAIRTYPLHPLTLLVLPHVFRRFAQNERSLFAYLSSNEPFAYQELARTVASGKQDLIRLPDLFDYLMANIGSSLYGDYRARSWVEAVDVLQRGKDFSSLQSRVLKTVALLATVGQISHLQAEEWLVNYALADSEGDMAIASCLRSLRDRSFISYRRFNHSYRLWGGSDVDVQERVDEGRRVLGTQSEMAATVQRLLPARPLVAVRHSYRTGALRYFGLRYVDDPAQVLAEGVGTDGAAGVVVCCLPSAGARPGGFREIACSPEAAMRMDLVVAVPSQTADLQDAVAELAALSWAQENTPQLRDDQIARRELGERIAAMEGILTRLIRRILDPRCESVGSACQWFWRGSLQSIDTPADVHRLLSSVCDELYSKAPRISNELVNRRLLSSAAAAARRNLIERILTRGDEPLLGIEGYPPERAIYDSVLYSSGVHGQMGPGTWGFSSPAATADLRPTWEAMYSMVFNGAPEPYPIKTLFEGLSAPPLGVMPGVLPLLFCAFLQVHSDETFLYREGVFMPDAGIADFELLVRRPDLFGVRGVRLSGDRATLVKRLASWLAVQPTVVPVVRALVRRVKGLPGYAWHTHRLKPTILAVREAFAGARSPEMLLFHALPVALGCEVISDLRSASDMEECFQSLVRTIDSWTVATTLMTEEARDGLLKACGLQVGEAGWRELTACMLLLRNVPCHPVLSRLAQTVAIEGDAPNPLERALGCITGRPPSSWSDTDVDRFGALAEQIGLFFREAIGFQGPSLSPPPDLSEEEVCRVRAISEGMRRYLSESLLVPAQARLVRLAILSLLQDLPDRCRPGGDDWHGGE